MSDRQALEQAYRLLELAPDNATKQALIEKLQATNVLPQFAVVPYNGDPTIGSQALSSVAAPTHSHVRPIHAQYQPNGYTNTLPPIQMIAMRLHLQPGEMLPFEFIEAYKLSAEEYVVFIVHNGEPITLRDDANLFPSDKLMGSLRLLRG